MSTPEIITVNSEALEAQIRDLLPSQSGFGSELQASNVIMPIIDLTATAEGSGLDVSLQQAVAHSSNTSFKVDGATTTIVSNTGFFRVIGTLLINKSSGTDNQGYFQVNDSSSAVIVWRGTLNNGSDFSSVALSYDFIVFLRAGDTLEAVSNDAQAVLSGSTRQVATVTGTLVNPVGFVAE